MDIRYRTSAGMHIIVELKRHGARVNIHDLTRQVQKYNDAMEKLLRAREDRSPQISIVCVLGGDPGPGDNTKRMQEQLKVHNARYVTYESLIHGAQRAYGEYIDRWEGVKDIKELVDKIAFPSPPPGSAPGQ